MEARPGGGYWEGQLERRGVGKIINQGSIRDKQAPWPSTILMVYSPWSGILHTQIGYDQNVPYTKPVAHSGSPASQPADSVLKA